MQTPTIQTSKRSRNPFRSKTRLERAQDELDAALDSIGDLTEELRQQAAVAATGAREAADSALDTAGDAADAAGEKAKELSNDRHVVAVLAGAIAAGVAAVAAKKLISSTGNESYAAPATAAGPPQTPLNDPAIKQKVESVIFRDAEAAKGDVSVTVANGAVELHGRVETDEQAAQLVDAASALDEVNRVESKLEIGTPAGKGSAS